MVLRKRRVTRRRNIRRKRVMRPRRVGLRQPVHMFKRAQFASSVITVTGGVDAYAAASFELQNIPSASEFTALYDQYKITGIKYQLMPRGNTAEVGSSAVQGNQCRIFSVLDYDDSVAPTSIAQLTQYQNLKVTNSTQTHTRYFKPRFNLDILSGSVGLTGNAPTTGWIDVTNADVKHRGLKLAIQAPPAGTYVYDLLVTYYLMFKNVR